MRDTISVDAESLAAFGELETASTTAWSVVVVFHPEASCTGAKSVLPVDEEFPTFGRDAPAFTKSLGEAVATLADPHISREAFTLRRHAGTWVIERAPGSSLVRINGCALDDARELGPAECAAGITVTLAHRIVLFLRLEELQRNALVDASIPSSLIGVSSRWQALLCAVGRAAESQKDVLILGPTGSGKELIARAIHAMRHSDPAPWVAVNMPALPADLAAASLFGVRRGAYTGADKSRPGLFQQAAGGTLFLDEIGDTADSVQPVLLRALQEREVQVVGGAPETVALQVIAATEIDPDAVDSRLRPALRHRLAGHELRVPPLDQRKEDIGVLVQAFLEAEGEHDVQWMPENASGAHIAAWARCIESLTLRAWPGNVRELEHIVSQIHTDSRGLPVLPARRMTLEESADDTQYDTASSSPQSETLHMSEAAPLISSPLIERSQLESKPAPLALSSMSDEDFLAHWARCNYEVAATARALSVSRAAVYRKLRTIDACRLAADVPLGELLSMLDQCRGDLRDTASQLKVSKRGLESRLRLAGIDAPNIKPQEPWS